MVSHDFFPMSHNIHIPCPFFSWFVGLFLDEIRDFFNHFVIVTPRKNGDNINEGNYHKYDIVS